MKAFYYAVLLLATSSALAGDAVLSWTLPIQNTDGSELTDLAGVKIYMEVHDTENPESTEWVHTGLLPGDYRYVSTAYNAEGEESVFSNDAIKVIDALKTADTRVYTMLKQPDKMSFLVVGSIELGVDCDVEQPMGPYYVVPRDQVSWSGNIQPYVVVAQCW